MVPEFSKRDAKGVTSLEKLLAPSASMEYVALDVETTGMGRNDRIVEIGLVAFSLGEIVDEWSTLLNPQRDVGKSSIHGITASMVTAAPLFHEVMNDIFRFLDNRVLVAHNLAFDLRMLVQEFGRTNHEPLLGKGFCTMIASRRILKANADDLTSTCEALGLTRHHAHTALGDARMVAQAFEHLIEDAQEVFPASTEFSPLKNPCRTFQRTAFGHGNVDAIERIQTFSRKIPFPTSEERSVAYLLMLNMAMQDLVISPAERSELVSWANGLGITETEVEILHKGYLESFIQAALRDGVITVKEREMIEMVGTALNLPVVIPEKADEIQENAENLSVGKRVCFTGEATGASGGAISREDLESLAAKVGLHPVKDVTKKGCDFLIAGDENSMSGKAKKAREWGIPIIPVDKFITYCTFGK